jgi:hypothetical protein
MQVNASLSRRGAGRYVCVWGGGGAYACVEVGGWVAYVSRPAVWGWCHFECWFLGVGGRTRKNVLPLPSEKVIWPLVPPVGWWWCCCCMYHAAVFV